MNIKLIIFILLMILFFLFIHFKPEKYTGSHTVKCGSSEILFDKKIIFISSIDEKLTKGFRNMLNKKLKKSIIILQSKNKSENIYKNIQDEFKKNDIILLCGDNLKDIIEVKPLCHIHVCPIKCETYEDIKKNKDLLLLRSNNKNDTWDNYWNNLMLVPIDEITYPTNYEKTCQKILKLLPST